MWEIVIGGPVEGEPIDLPHIPWTVYAYGLNGFARERVLSCNPNVIGYSFPPNTQAMSYFFLLSSLFTKFLFLF